MSTKTKRKPARPAWQTKIKTAIKTKTSHPSHYDFPLRTLNLAAPLQIAEDGVFAWFILDPLNWEFMPVDERIIEHDGQMSRWGQLAEQCGTPEGRPFHERRTSVPFAAYECAARLDAEANPDNKKVWNEFLAHMQNRLRSTGLDPRMSAVGLWIADVPSAEAIADLAGAVEHPRKEAVDILNAYAETAATMAGGGMKGRPATPIDMAFLMHRSLSMGMPAPVNPGLGAEPWANTRWDGEGLGEFTARSAWITEPLGDHVKIVGDVEGVQTERYVAVLSTGIMPEKVWPQAGSDGWMMAMDRLGFPVEASVKGILQTGAQAESDAAYNQRRAGFIEKDYREHRLDPPEAVGRAIRATRQALDEITEGDSRVAPQAFATVRWAIYGATLEEVNDRARQVVVFAKDKLRFPVTRTVDQARELRGFIPGEPDVPNGFRRTMTTGYLSAAMPNIDAQVGTPTGFYLGYSSLSRRAVLFNPHWAPENNRPGLYTIAGEPGSGKSFLSGTLAYNMVMAGIPTVIEDPSGPLAKLCRLPELAPLSAEVNLARADEGTMSPPQMIAEPVRDNFRDEHGDVDELDYQRAVKSARAERRQLSFDVMRMLLSPSLLRMPGADQRLQAAIRAMAGTAKPGIPESMFNLRWAIDYLGKHRKGDDTVEAMWAELNEASEFVSVAIPGHRDPVEDIGLPDKRLVVITMPGIAAPSGDKEDWGSGRYAMPLIHLSVFLAGRSIYSKDREVRKGLIIDEGDTLFQMPSGLAFARRVWSDSRKYDVAAFFADQESTTPMLIGERASSLIGGQFIGRLRKKDAAERACRMAEIDLAYAPVIQKLRTGEFVMTDPEQRTAKIIVDKDWHPSLQALNTTPRGKRAAYSLDLPPAPVLDPRLFGDAENVFPIYDRAAESEIDERAAV